MMQKKISPSIMCADFLRLEDCIRSFEKCNIDMIHIDIMDGSFVPNYTLGTDFIKRLKKSTNIPLDIHLMIDKPENKLDWFDFGENDYVSVHIESAIHINKALNMIRARGAKAMVALNPGTPLCLIENVLDDTDGILLMTVNPGFAGQRLVNSTIDKIKKLRNYLDNAGKTEAEIEVDGNVSFENSVFMSNAGANIFVAGTSSVFTKDSNLTEAVNKLRNCVNG